MTVAAIAGASGYAGGELLRLLLQHPHVEIGPIAAASNAGERVLTIHPNLAPLADRHFSALDPAELGTADIVFLALPHGTSANVARGIPADVPIVDLGADHRLGDSAAWSGYYPGEWAGAWTYGMPELLEMRDRIASAARVASPGCYPTGVILGLSPLLAASLALPDDVVVVAASGTSGAGRTPSVKGLAAEVMGSMSAYKVGGSHQHTPEIEQALGWAADSTATVSFTPILAPMPRGILAVTTAPVAPGTTTETVREALHEAYLGEPFITVLPADVWPTTGATLGSNTVQLQAAVDTHANRVVVVSALDNLVKGAAGQALQNANLMLGFDETAGLSAAGMAP